MWRNWDVVNVRSLVYTIQNPKITSPILTMVVKFNPHQIAAKTTEVDDKEKNFLEEEIRTPTRTRYTSNHILKVKRSLKKSIFWMKKLHFWISTPMWRVAKKNPLNFEEQLAPILAPLQHQLKVLASLVQNPAPSPPRKRNKHDQNPVMFS